MSQNGQTVQSVERAFHIMECFSLDNPKISLGEISKRTGLSKSTVFRLLATLASLGYIKQDPVSQEYSLGFKLFHLGSVVVGNMDLRTISLPYLKELSRETSETISLNIAEENDRVCIEIVESPETIRNFTKIGQRNRLWIGASGKILLANLETSKRDEILVAAYKTGELLMDIELLERELDEIKRNGYAVTTNERISGSFAVVAPIFDHTGFLSGGITLAGPLQRMTEERVPVLVEKVTKTASNISKELGYVQ